MTSALLSRLAADAGFNEPAIVLDALTPGAPSVRLDGEAPLYPASMIKVPIAFALEAVRARGALELTDTVTVSQANMTTNDAPSPFVPGYVARVGELGHAMLAASDNVATNVLIDVLGRAEIDAACARLGLTQTRVRRKLSGSLPLIDDPSATGRNVHPPSEAAMLFARLARADRPAWIWNALCAQVWNDKLSRGLGPFTTFAHKTGDTDEVSHDGGLLELPSGRRFVIVVYTALVSNAETDARHAAFARALRPHLGA
jgi:beta-lactamase class A